MRDDGSVKTKVVCNIIAINMEGKKEIIGSYITENEGSKFWLEVLTDLANRGVKDITYSMRRWPKRLLLGYRSYLFQNNLMQLVYFSSNKAFY